LDCVPERVSALDDSVYDQGICAFSTEIPAENASFDAILGGEFIEHVPPTQVDATLAEFFRVLRLHGRLILTTPNPGFLKNKLRKLSVLLEKSHLSQHHPDCLKHRLRATGYSRVRIFGSGRMTQYIGQRFPWLPLYGSYLIQADKW
jgi:predicted SAM-dependent methyltransferase